MAVNILNRVGYVVTQTGQGTINIATGASLISNRFNTIANSGAADSGQYYFILEEDQDYELFIGTVATATPTVARTTVLMSRIGGSFGTTKMTLAGNATLKSVTPAEMFAQLLFLSGGTLSGAVNWNTMQDVASASTSDIGAATSNYVRITGTTTITDLGTIASGAVRYVRFNAALTLTHNATSLILPGGANITTAAGDTALFVSEGSGNWRCLIYQKASGLPILSTLLPYGKQAIWIPAAAMKSRTTNGAAAGSIEMTTNKNMVVTFDFDATTQEFTQFFLQMPKSWNESTVSFYAVWSHASTTTNFGVAWNLAGVAISDNETLDVAFGTAQQVTDTGGTTNRLYITAESSAITIGGTPAEGDHVNFQVARVPADAADTMAIDARLHGIMLFITTDTGNDA